MASQELPDKPHIDPARQISKAIENRTIAGIRVSVNDDIAYLGDRVATERTTGSVKRRP